MKGMAFRDAQATVAALSDIREQGVPNFPRIIPPGPDSGANTQTILEAKATPIRDDFMGEERWILWAKFARQKGGAWFTGAGGATGRARSARRAHKDHKDRRAHPDPKVKRAIREIPGHKDNRVQRVRKGRLEQKVTKGRSSR
jgi:hypothetical protein